MRLILLGANGMFGRDASGFFRRRGHQVIPADLPEVDITDAPSLQAWIGNHPADLVVNAAAYTDVDGAETHREEAFRVNAEGAGNAARACLELKLPLVHISTDYVFPGDNSGGYRPEDAPGPAVNVYGKSKLAGERLVESVLPEELRLVCRTQWLYGRHGKNFVDTIAALARERDSLRIVNDQWGVPTHTLELARQMTGLLESGARGTAHTVGGAGPVTWYRVGCEIVKTLGSPCRVEPCASQDFVRPAPRPRHAWLAAPEGVGESWTVTLTAYLAGKDDKGADA